MCFDVFVQTVDHQALEQYLKNKTKGFLTLAKVEPE